MGDRALAPTGLVSAAVLFVFVISCGGPAELDDCATAEAQPQATQDEGDGWRESVAGLAVLAESDRVESISTLAPVYPGDRCSP